MMPVPHYEPESVEQGAICVCGVCGMPMRVIFRDGEPMQVLAPCGHPKSPAPVHREEGKGT